MLYDQGIVVSCLKYKRVCTAFTFVCNYKLNAPFTTISTQIVAQNATVVLNSRKLLLQ